MLSLRQIGFCVAFLFVAGFISFFVIDDRLYIKGSFFEEKIYKPVIVSGGDKNNYLIRNLPGQPSNVTFNQYSGYINVDWHRGRRLFYYFVEADHPEPHTRPLILWLHGGPEGCSSLGMGAFVEHGPFEVGSDGRTLYRREFSWNRVANVIYLESPAGVGFSYSNTTSDYTSPGDSRIARDSLIFLVNWFHMFTTYKNNDFYIAGEDYAGFYVPELATLLLEHNHHAHPTSAIRLKGVMVGNGFMNLPTDYRGMYDYMWTHALISYETHRGLIKYCLDSDSPKCSFFYRKLSREIGEINFNNIYSDQCFSNSSNNHKKVYGIVVCDEKYVTAYLNLPEVQKSMYANATRLSYPWSMCSSVNQGWGDSLTTTFPLYRKLIAARVRILIYNGDVDGVIPVTSTRYSLKAMNLRLKTGWRPWYDETQQVAGFRVIYDGLTFMTVLGAGHEVPRDQPQKAFSLLKFFLERM